MCEKGSHRRAHASLDGSEKLVIPSFSHSLIVAYTPPVRERVLGPNGQISLTGGYLTGGVYGIHGVCAKLGFHKFSRIFTSFRLQVILSILVRFSTFLLSLSNISNKLYFLCPCSPQSFVKSGETHENYTIHYSSCRSP